MTPSHKDALGWGFGLWIFGYLLGFFFYVFLPPRLIGWAIMPFGILATLWVVKDKIESRNMHYLLRLGAIWALLAIILDFFFIFLLLRPTDGYYKLDVCLYYLFTLLLPAGFAWWEGRRGA